MIEAIGDGLFTLTLIGVDGVAAGVLPDGFKNLTKMRTEGDKFAFRGAFTFHKAVLKAQRC